LALINSISENQRKSADISGFSGSLRPLRSLRFDQQNGCRAAGTPDSPKWVSSRGEKPGILPAMAGSVVKNRETT
jgi:hypothetical protein